MTHLKLTNIYASRCKACHGADGLGKWLDDQGYIFPPLVDEDLFSDAGKLLGSASQ